MSHEIESIMYVGQTPWHGLGVRLNAPPSIKEAILQSGLDWPVSLRPLYTSTKPLAAGEMPTDLMVVPDNLAIVRDDRHEVLGVVGPDYKPLQNAEAFEFFQPFLDAGQVEIETAGSLRGGKKIWVLAKVKVAAAEVVRGDPLLLYFLLSNGHDGKSAVLVSITPIRVVCANTEGIADMRAQHGLDKSLRFAHVGDVQSTLKAVQDVVDLANRTFHATIEQFQFLATRRVENIREYVYQVIGVPSETRELIACGKEELPRAVKLIEHKFISSPSIINIPGVAGTWWGAYNAFTEYVDHQRGTVNHRLHSAWFGTGRQMKERALNLATELAQAL